eukprot:TRINITY_DN12652_c0_g1_i1.p1 TRINITY_DN12652_c0_g1~~TRINITY_DN12652_c0_g1_i1.p1  ORF type:complete len:667 (-),score=155.30 TRINITY_DN12652_c0_g1_i1:38-1951(-)
MRGILLLLLSSLLFLANCEVLPSDSTLQILNEIRGGVYPPSIVSLPLLSWDTDLARRADEWTTQCLWTKNRANLLRRTEANANSFGIPGGITFEQASQFWKEENRNLKWTVANLQLAKNYSAIVWENSTSVGCAVNNCTSAGLGLYYQCLFSFRGNYVGRLPYRATCQLNPDFDCATLGCGNFSDGCRNVSCGDCKSKASISRASDPNIQTIAGSHTSCLTYKSCRGDNPSGPSFMSALTFQSVKMTVDACVTYCKDRKWDYAALRGSQTCSCDYTFGTGSVLNATQKCGQRCGGNADQYCGDVGSLLVYDVSKCSPVSSCQELGCYSTFYSSIGAALPTQASCKSFCQSKGKSYGAFSGTSWCHCSDSIYPYSKVNSSLCNIPCLDFKGNCGGNNYFQVFQTYQCSVSPGVEYVAPKDSMDWRERGNFVTPIRDQGKCGSCWAHAGAATLESAWAIAGKGLVTLSPQQILDCTSYDCSGGWMDAAYNWALQNGGVAPVADQPYNGVKKSCNAEKTGGEIVMQSPSFENVCNNYEEEGLFQAVRKGPVAVGILMDESKVHFSNGIYLDNWQPSDGINHAVTVIGYGTDDTTGIDYWIAKNSWGTKWGDGGYFKVGRNRGGFGVMGILSGCTRPLVKV